MEQQKWSAAKPPSEVPSATRLEVVRDHSHRLRWGLKMLARGEAPCPCGEPVRSIQGLHYSQGWEPLIRIGDFSDGDKGYHMHSLVPIHHQEFLPEVGHPGVSGVVALKSRDEGGFFLGSAAAFKEVSDTVE